MVNIEYKVSFSLKKISKKIFISKKFLIDRKNHVYYSREFSLAIAIKISSG